MPLLLRISLRNLFRQKRRNLFLGSAMAIGIMLLVLANSFSHGISDIMLNKVLRWVTGHVTISFSERGRMNSAVFRDKSLFDFIQKDYQNLGVETEEAIGTMVRAIGNGKAENLILVATDLSAKGSEKTEKESKESFQLVEGKWSDLNNPNYENPVFLSTDRAHSLNVKRFDILRLRLRNVLGQDQSARVTVIGTLKTSNIFMGPVTFGEMKNVKTILGYDAHSTGNINMVVKNPEKNARALADAIHARLHPGLAIIAGTLESSRQTATVLGMNSDPSLQTAWAPLLELTSGNLEKIRADKTALVSEPLAKASGLKTGSTFSVRYTDKWGSPDAWVSGRVGGIFKPKNLWGSQVILMQDDRFYEAFYSHLPQPAQEVPGAFIPEKNHQARALLAPDWVLLPRTYTTADLEKKMKELGKKKWHATVVDVRTMYETAEQILKLEGALNLITLGAVLVLFIIILIGVVNTLRMAIRERTREIGTIRAIGMQQNDVRNIFILETLLLALFASLAGVLLAFLAMWGLSSLPMRMEDNPMGMLLVNSHLYFIPSWKGILGNIALILLLAGATSYFPARRAARLAPGAALRHFE